MIADSKVDGSIEVVEDAHTEEVLSDAMETSSSVQEKQLVRKLDMRLMPVLCIMYLFAYLDRINLGNARLQGLPQDVLNGDPTGVLFDWVTSGFYFSYIICPVPAVLLFKLFRPRMWFGCAVLGWGISSMLMATTFNFAGLMVTRIALGAFEAMFSPATPIYLSLFYTKEEIGLRIAIYNGVAAVAGAFGGLVAFAIQHAALSIPNWKLLFLVEGAPSIVCGLWAFVLLLDRPEDTPALRGDERKLALDRANRGSRLEAGRVFQRKHIIAAFVDWRVYAAGIIYFAANCAFASIAAFLPTIITTFGFTNALAQLLTIPPYVVSTIAMCSCCYASDKLQVRGKFVIANSLLSGLGYVLLLAVPSNNHVRYFATFCITSGTYGMICTTLAWFTYNLGSESKRAAAIPLFQAIGQCGSVLGSHLYPLAEGPRYIKGFSVNCALDFLAVVVAVALMISYQTENSKKDLRYGKRINGTSTAMDTTELADRAPSFRYTL